MNTTLQSLIFGYNSKFLFESNKESSENPSKEVVASFLFDMQKNGYGFKNGYLLFNLC